MNLESSSLFGSLAQVAPIVTLLTAFWVMLGFARPNPLRRFLIRCLVFFLLWFTAKEIWNQLLFLLNGEGISWGWFFFCVLSFVLGVYFVLKKTN